ncbi:hypothetical protein [Candidatus Avelusimicrobium sp.]
MYPIQKPTPRLFETVPLPQWFVLLLWELVHDPESMPGVQIEHMPPELKESHGVSINEMGKGPERVCYVRISGNYEADWLKLYLQAYTENRLPVQHYKTFEKSIRATIDFLKAAEQSKGHQFGLDGLNRPLADLRFYSDLVYLQQKGMIELESPDVLCVDSSGYIKDIKVILKIPAEDIAQALLPPVPDCQYRNLQYFENQRKFVYRGMEYIVQDTGKKWVKLLVLMMKHKTRYPWTQVVKDVGIQKQASDNGKGALENVIHKSVNEHLHKWGFSQELGLSRKHVVWKDVK